MGDRYDLSLDCVYCGESNEVYYAPTCRNDTFRCKDCGKVNFITFNFKAKKVKDLTETDIEKGFIVNTNASWTEEQIKEMCKDRLRQIKGG